MKIYKIVIGLIMFFYSSFVFADELNLVVDKKVLSEGDILRLSIIYNGSENGKPDLSSLQNDFQIVSSSSSSQMQQYMGSVSQSKKWTVGLRPLKSGKIIIKPISFGGLTSNYEEVEVKELTDVAYIPDSENNFNSPFFKIEMSIDDNKVYLHQQINVLVTIYDSLGLKDGRIDLVNETKQNWIIKQLSQRPYMTNEVIGGKNMSVIKFWYAMFPQKSGDLVMPRFRFDGYYIKNVNLGIDSFHNDFMMLGVDFRNAFGQKVPVKMETKEKIINVLPNIEGVLLKDWLPLKALEINENISAKKGFKVGEAFSQNIEIKAVGIEKNMFPDIKIPNSNYLKQYPEKPEFVEEIIDGNIVTTAKYNIVYIPYKGGDFELPQIMVKWFNLNTNQEEVSLSKKEFITVFQNQDFSSFSEDVKKENEVIFDKNKNINIDKKEDKLKKENSDNITLKKLLSFNFIIIIGVLAILFILLLKGKKTNKTNAFYRKEVISAIERHDYHLAKSKIIVWAKIKFGDDEIKNFGDITRYVNNSHFEKQLDILNKLLYSKSDELLDSVDFIKTFKNIDKVKVKKDKKEDVLPNLYN